VEQVTFCWRHWQAGEVLLVFDDVTDYAAIKPYLPPSTAFRFKVLITTRLRLGASVNQLELEVLDESAALALLESLVGSDQIQPERDCAQQLCTQLGYLPLGLELVGRYLARKPDLSLTVMQQRLQDKRLVALALRQTDADMTARLGVVAAFELSWETLSESAKSLGYLLSLFAAAPIPWLLLEQCLADQDPETLEETRDSELLNLHLLQRTNPETYRLHPLIRDFFQTKLAHSPQSDTLKQRICKAMAAVALQVPEVPTQPQILAVAPAIPHIAEVATQLQDWLSNDDLIAPYVGLGQFYGDQGAYAQAEPWYTQCRSVSLTRLGNNHPDVATNLNGLAELYRVQGRFSEAEPLYQRALAIREQQLGVNHPDVAEALNNLALLYSDQGRYSEAESLHQRALAIWEQQLGAEHPLVATSLNNLANLYHTQGRYSEAESLHQRALAIREQQLGAEHPLVAYSLNGLAIIYWNQERYSEAEPLYQRALAIQEQQLGSNHPRVAALCQNLAFLYSNQGRYSDAESLHQRSLAIREQQLGADHPHVAYSLNGLATLYRDQGRYSEAKPLFQRALDIWKQALGEAHSIVGRGLDNLAMLHAAQGHEQVAEVLYVQAIEILEQGLGAEHPWTVRCRENLEQLRNRS
jgi:tetratricopeptide (TPR) repeat protein